MDIFVPQVTRSCIPLNFIAGLGEGFGFREMLDKHYHVYPFYMPSFWQTL